MLFRSPTDRWVVLEESSDNIEKFYLYMSKRNISLEDVRIYYNDTEAYFKIQEGIELRGKLEKELSYYSLAYSFVGGLQ